MFEEREVTILSTVTLVCFSKHVGLTIWVFKIRSDPALIFDISVTRLVSFLDMAHKLSVSTSFLYVEALSRLDEISCVLWSQ